MSTFVFTVFVNVEAASLDEAKSILDTLPLEDGDLVNFRLGDECEEIDDNDDSELHDI